MEEPEHPSASRELSALKTTLAVLPRRAWVAVALVAALVVAGLVIGLREGDVPPGRNAVPGSDATPTATSPAGTPTVSPAAGTTTSAARGREGMTVSVPAVGVRARVLPISPSGGALNPPTLDKAYLIEPYGKPGSKDNTVYITGHSWDRGKAVFNPLFDRRAQTSEVEKGDEVLVASPEGQFTYVVDKTERYRRTALSRADEVWRKVPDRLLLITCFQPEDGGEIQDNLVVYATLTSVTPPA
jgi:sortase (surface protein transpeptidase)